MDLAGGINEDFSLVPVVFITVILMVIVGKPIFELGWGWGLFGIEVFSVGRIDEEIVQGMHGDFLLFWKIFPEIFFDDEQI